MAKSYRCYSDQGPDDSSDQIDPFTAGGLPNFVQWLDAIATHLLGEVVGEKRSHDGGCIEIGGGSHVSMQECSVTESQEELVNYFRARID